MKQFKMPIKHGSPKNLNKLRKPQLIEEYKTLRAKYDQVYNTCVQVQRKAESAISKFNTEYDRVVQEQYNNQTYYDEQLTAVNRQATSYIETIKYLEKKLEDMETKCAECGKELACTECKPTQEQKPTIFTKVKAWFKSWFK